MYSKIVLSEKKKRDARTIPLFAGQTPTLGLLSPPVSLSSKPINLATLPFWFSEAYLSDSGLNEFVGLEIAGCRGLVQNQNFGLAQDGPCQTDKLPLADTKVLARLCYSAVEAVFQRLNIFLKMSRLQRPPEIHVAVLCKRVNVLADRPGEKHRVLCSIEHQPSLACQATNKYRNAGRVQATRKFASRGKEEKRERERNVGQNGNVPFRLHPSFR